MNLLGVLQQIPAKYPVHQNASQSFQLFRKTMAVTLDVHCLVRLHLSYTQLLLCAFLFLYILDIIRSVSNTPCQPMCIP